MSKQQLSDKIVPWPANINYDKQAFPVSGTKKPGQSAHYRNGIWGLIDEHTPNVFITLDQIWADGLRLAESQEFLGWRPRIGPGKYANYYEWITYAQADVRRRNIGSAVHKLFKDGVLRGEDYETVGIWAPNRPEWQLVDIALQTYDKVGVSLYDTLGRDSVVPVLKYVVCFDALLLEVESAIKEWGSSHGITVLQLSELEDLGKANPIEPIPATPDTVATICYTSGTTNTPKGVVLKHKTLAMSIQSYFYGRDLPADAVLFSYLPLAHIYERMAELVAIANGGKIGYFSGDPLRLLEDAQILKPHFFPSVPRVLNRIYQSAMLAKEAPGVKGALFRKALATKLQNLEQTGEMNHALWDRLVFKKIQAVLGGRIQFIGSGSAPITPDVLKFLRVSFACDVVEGYGLTETAACCSRTWQGDPNGTGTVGPPSPVNEVKLVDVPSMGYTAEDKPYPRGELCVRGAIVFSHYYKDEKNTKEALDADGWFHTGDVASIDSAGRIKIIDRVKNIMKLAQGEYVALEKVENIYSTVPVVAQVFVYGDGTQSYLVSVAVPEPVAFSALASSVLGKKVDVVNGGEEGRRAAEEAVRDPRVVAKVLDMLTKEAQKNGLKGFEMVKRLHLTLEPFSIEDGTLTPTMKLRRKDAYNKYKTEIDALYALGEPVGGSGGAGAVKL
ncbi:long-chain acyl-CoA synthetase [Coprinopsis cinerea okayama7|uniref:Long-chain acyl-CoA synthetase n=1 Tax=Coprinopsis cinerea (strain Okayama-7 / 130 / ATCC MYA-4618 / FGSC 9003) TaxID=240176 RepID=A8N130_COPC7|nr:long-chain acyl-CoA synthetase [Coprinopsis cinerea okayama7\|eukprot:XP_001828579.2 long-chain acyl-CoA synthetase [Coprinopsis cinerea okayama7\